MPTLQLRMYGVLISGSIVAKPRENVKSDCGIGNENDAGMVTSDGIVDDSVRPPGVKPGCPGRSDRFWTEPGLPPAAVENDRPAFVVVVHAEVAADDARAEQLCEEAVRSARASTPRRRSARS